MIKVDAGACIGCLSCSTVCPSQNITRTETERTRSIHWKRCKEECDLCVELCPARALALVPFDESVPEPEVTLELVACKICGAGYATEPMLQRIESTLPENVQRDASGLAWVRICPVCRREIEAERAAGQLVLERRRKSI